ncbi:MAG: SCO family protein [Phycisphaerales bacterium]
MILGSGNTIGFLTRVVLALVVVCASSAAASAQVLLKKDDVPALRGLDEPTEHLGARIPLDLIFQDQHAEKRKLSEFFDGKRPVVLAMVYYRCPVVCPTTINKLGQRLNELELNLGDNYQTLVVSFDPTEGPNDSMKWHAVSTSGYARKGVSDELVEKSWTFLTSSDPQTPRALADALGFTYKYLPEANEYSHSTVIFVITPQGKISRYLYGLEFPPKQLKLALVEASGGRVGSTFDRIIMFCFHWDPNTGKYTLAVVRLMRLCGVVTISAVSLLLVRLWLVDRRRRRIALQLAPVSPKSPNPPTPLPA